MTSPDGTVFSYTLIGMYQTENGMMYLALHPSASPNPLAVELYPWTEDENGEFQLRDFADEAEYAAAEKAFRNFFLNENGQKSEKASSEDIGKVTGSASAKQEENNTGIQEMSAEEIESEFDRELSTAGSADLDIDELLSQYMTEDTESNS